MIKQIFFYVLFLSLFIGEVQAKENIITSDSRQIINYKNSEQKVRDLIQNKSLTFEVSTGSISCDENRCLLDTTGIYEGNIQINTKFIDKIIKTDYYIINKYKAIDISNKFKYKRLQKYSLSCEISATADIISAIIGKKVDEDELIEKIDKASFYNKKPTSYKGQRLWGNPNDGFVGNINNAFQNNYTGYGVLEKPISRLFQKYGINSHIVNKYSYNSLYQQNKHLTDLFKEINKGNFVLLWGDYLTNPLEEDGTISKKLNQEQADIGLSGINYSKNWDKDRNISWNFMRDSKLYEYIGLNGEHAFYLLGYEGEIDNPTKIIVWDTKTGKHKYSIKEWMRKWNLMQNRSLIIEGN